MNLKAQRRGFGAYSALVSLFISLSFIGIGFPIYFSGFYIAPSWQRIDGTVSSISSNRSADGVQTYTAIVQYMVNGIAYNVSTIGSSSLPVVGDKRQVAYDPSSPQRAKVVEDLWVALLVLLIPLIGLGLLVYTVVAYLGSRKRGQDISQLKRTGHKVQGIITDVNNGMDSSEMRIVVTAPDLHGQSKNFTSDTLNSAAGLNLMTFRQNPIAIDVYIDPNNPESYYVDLEDIPQLNPQQILDLIKGAANKD